MARSISSEEGEFEAEEYYEQSEQAYEDGQEDVRADVRADEVLEEDLPPVAFTRDMLAKFRSMEDVDMAPPTPEYSDRKMKVAYSSVGPSPVRRFDTHTTTISTTIYKEQSDGLEQTDGTDTTQEYYEGYTNPVEAGEFENEPLYNPDIIREGDVNDVLPESGTTRHLLAKFQSMQAS